MFLTPRQIRRRLRTKSPTDKKLIVSPISDNTLGDNGSINLSLGSKFYDTLAGEHTSDEYSIAPSSFIVAVTTEYISIPADLVGFIQGKSSWGRIGLLSNTNTYINPGFSGHLTIELANLGTQEIALKRGLNICFLMLSFKDGKPSDFDLQENEDDFDIDFYFAPFDKEIFSFLAKHPEYLTKLSPRRFEELIAEILAEMGYEVRLTPASRDGGRDIFAYIGTPIGKLLTIVECKRYMPGHNVGIEIVERFLWTINEKDNASCGLIATTSQFTRGALDLQKKYAWKLHLKALNDLQGWMEELSGDFSFSKDRSLWVQTNTLANKSLRRTLLP